ncbi:MAG TPA: aldose 1-epimerase [Azospirillum sp.]
MLTSPAALRHPAVVSIASGPLTLDVAPEIGGSIARFRGRRGGRRDGRVIDWLRPATEEALAARDPLGMASFPLIPFCNRVRDGRFSFGGTEVRLPANYAHSRHAIHGHAWQRPWTVVERAPDAVTLAFEHRPDAWPYRYDARQTYELADDGLTVRLSVTNRGGVAMPLGLGHHPYLPRTPDTTVTARVDAIWSTDAEVMPTRMERTWVTDRLATGLRVADADLDNNFTGWDRTALVRWPELDVGLRMTAGAALDFLVAYTPAAEDFFCLEPVGNCTDWPNLTQLGSERVGGMVLPAGETATVWFRLEPVWTA